MRKVFQVVTILLAASAVLQLYFAAVGVFSSETNDPFALHEINGRIVLPIVVLLTILFAALAHAGRQTIRLTVIVFGLLVLQTLFVLIPSLIFGVEPRGENIPAVATALMALHGINGGVIVAMSGTLVGRARQLAMKAEPAPSSEPAGMDSIPRP